MASNITGKKRTFAETDILEEFCLARKRLETESNRFRYVSNDKIPRDVKWRVSETREWMDKQNANIDNNIHNEIETMVLILKQVIVSNSISKLKELISHGICEQLIKYCDKNETNSKNDSSIYDCRLSKIVTEIVGLILIHNRIDCLVLLNPFIDVSLFDISKFDEKFESNPLECIMFLCENDRNESISKSRTNSNNRLFDIKSNHCKMLFKCCECGFYDCVVYCISQGCQIDSCRNRAIRDSSRFGYLKIVQFLIENGANFHDCREESLRKASRHGHLPIVKYLCHIGTSDHSSINDNSNNKTSVIHTPADITILNYQCVEWAIKNGHYETVEFLLQECIRLLETRVLDNSSDIRKKRTDLMDICINCNHFKTILPLLIYFGFTLSKDNHFRKLMLNDKRRNNNENNNENNNGILDILWNGFNLRKTQLISILAKYITSNDVCNIIYQFEFLASC